MFSLNYRELWAGTSSWLTDELDQIAASAQAKWGGQHTDSGAHGDVTATSVSSPILSLGAPLEMTIPDAYCLGNFGIPLVLPRRTSFVSLNAFPTALTWASIDSIEVPGVQEGDILVVYLRYFVRLNSKAKATYTAGPGNRLAMNDATAPDITYSGETFGQTTAADIGTAVTFIRHNRADYTDSLLDRFPAWVQIG